MAPGTLATNRSTARADRCVDGGARPWVIDCCTQYSAISRTDRFSTCFENTCLISLVLSHSTGTIGSACDHMRDCFMKMRRTSAIGSVFTGFDLLMTMTNADCSAD